MEPSRASTIPAQVGKQHDGQATPSSASGTTADTTTKAVTSQASTSAPSFSTSTSAAESALPVLDPSSFTTGKGGGALRSIDQNFTVNPSKGTLSLSVPLPVSQSRGKFQPSLNLSYDSGSGNGPFGIGWSLNRQSITRKTSSQIPSYDDKDVFVFMGEDLVPLETADRTVAGHIVKEYALRVRTEDEIRVEKWSSTTDCGEIFWRTISSNNITSFYGKDGSSREFEKHPTGVRVFSWLVCESYDGNGNAIAYSYKAEDDVGLDSLPADQKALEITKDPNVRTRARYTKSVTYGNRLPSRDLESWEISRITDDTQWCFSVVFDYGEHDLSQPTTSEVDAWHLRADRFSSARSGFEIRNYRLCRRALMFHHFPEKLGRQDYLVSSMNLSYEENPCGTLMHSLYLEGHAFDEKGQRYVSESMTPLRLTYSALSPMEQIQMKTIRPASLQNLNSSNPRAITRWLDLDGEGSPGLLVQMDGAWFFQRNENGINSGLDSASASSDSEEDSTSEEESEAEIVDQFGPVRQLRALPNAQDYSRMAFEDLDGNGLQDIVLVDDHGKVSGFHERYPDTDDWSHFQHVNSVPNLNLNDTGFKRLDLTGNGIADLLIPGEVPGELNWHPSLGKHGFDIKRACAVAQGRDASRISFLEDDHTAVFLADMTGDGLQDIVHISIGRVSYFPNQSHGRFGLEVTMCNAPTMDDDGVFSTERIQLLDLDGSGTTDLIYLAPSGGATAYYNECGNGFSSGTQLPQFPQVDRLSSVFTLDILGKGTSCICWAGPEDASTDDVVIRYLDLAPRCKPHLLTSYGDGNGQETRVKYRPSNTFFLRDERQGRKWNTNLPFPVHVVRQVVKRDELEGYRQTTTYGYHDGYYDPIDREFRGFGAVDTWEAETLAAFKDQRFKTPVRHTKTWYHTGAPEVSLVPERIFGDPKATSSIPSVKAQHSRRECFRALKGFEFRNEVYVHDGTRRSKIPHSVKESTYKIEVLSEPKSPKAPGISRVLPQETVSLSYHGELDNPKVQHDMVLTRNIYGSVTKMLNVRYGCVQSKIAIREQEEIQPGRKKKEEIEQAETRDQIKSNQELLARTLQEAHYASLTETTYTDVIYEDNSFYTPVVSRTKHTHYTGFTIDGLISFASAKQDVTKLFGSSQVSRGKETRTYFRTSDLTGRLPLDKIKYMPVIDQSYDLAITQDQSKSIRLGPAESLDELLQAGGYVCLEGGDWWRPTSRMRFSKEEKDELKQARASFFTPTVQKDPFDNVSTVGLDDYFLLATQSTDAIGKTTLAVNCYRSLRAIEMADPNANRSRVEVDLFGEIVATAQMGKREQALGDLPDTDIEKSGGAYLTSREEAESFLKSPDESTARLLLGGWHTRTLIFRRRLDLGGVKVPRFRIDIVGSEHARSTRDSKISVQFTFLSGSQRTLQTTSLSSWEQSKWSVSGRTVNNAAGQPFQTYQPFFATHPGYHHHQDITTPSSFSFLDPLGRQVGILHADKTWAKTWHTAWSTVTWDEGATLSITNPHADQHLGYYFRELYGSRGLTLWLERCRSSDDVHVQATANEAAATFAHRCLTVHSSALDIDIVRVEQTGPHCNRAMIFKHDAYGNIETEHDPLGRIVQQSQFDALGRSFAVTNMDTGTKTSISDCMNGSLYSGILGGPAQRTFLDAMRRPIEIRVRQKPEDVADIIWSRFVYGDNVQDALERNVVGRLIRVEDQAGVREVNAYDFKGNVSSETRRLTVEYKKCIDWGKEESIELEDSLRISTEYDAMNRPVLANDMLGRVTRRTFDLLGNLASLSSKGSEDTEWVLHTKSIEYTADGLTSERELCDGLITRYIYDEDSRLLLRKMTKNTRGGRLEDITYTYDCAGRLTRSFDAAQEMVFFRNQKLQAVKEYSYDAAGQLIRARGREQLQVNGIGVRSSPSSTGADTPDGHQMVGYTESYTYDDAFNILVMSHQVSDAATQGWTRRYSYEAESLIEPERRGNKVTSTETAEGIETFTYNATGSMVRMPGFSQITWDCLENMRSITRQVITDKASTPETTWFTYDAGGNRVRKVTERAHATDSERGVKLKETKYVGTAQKYIVYAGDGVSTRKVAETSHIYGLLDSSPTVSIEKLEKGAALMRYLVSPNLEVDDQGSTVSYEEYSPFGASTLVVCGKGITAPSDFRFASYRRDTETGLYHCGKRYYCPRLARWTSADSLGTADGPNIYCYCGNDPVNYNDKKGTSREGEGPAQGNQGNPNVEQQQSKWSTYMKDKMYAGANYVLPAVNYVLPTLVNTAITVGVTGFAVKDVFRMALNPPADEAAATLSAQQTIETTVYAALILSSLGQLAVSGVSKLTSHVANHCIEDEKYKKFLSESSKLRPEQVAAETGNFVEKQVEKYGGADRSAVYQRLTDLGMAQNNAPPTNLQDLESSFRSGGATGGTDSRANGTLALEMSNSRSSGQARSVELNEGVQAHASGYEMGQPNPGSMLQRQQRNQSES